MDNRLSVFEEYLRTPNSNYAILLNGKWGTGKTFWFKNKIKPIIESTSTLFDERIKYKMVYISLYGINSVDEIQKAIFLEFYHILNKSKIKASYDITKLIGDAYLNYKGIKNFDKLFTTIEGYAKNYLNLDRIVVCFDDIERIGSNLKLSDLAGLISNLVENKGVKTILLMNEDKIEDKVPLRDKIVGINIEFIPIIEEIYPEIVEKNYTSLGYKNFLIENKDYIYSLFNSELHNLRYYVFGLRKFQLIYSEIKNYYDGQKIKEVSIDKILLDCFKLTIALSYEFKDGNDPKHILNELGMDSKQRHERLTALWKGGVKKDDPFRFDFIKKYKLIHDGDVYFHSIGKYVMGVTDFKIEEFLNEVTGYSKYILIDIPVHISEFELLRYFNCYVISDEEYIKKTQQLYKNAISGIFTLQFYPIIFHFLVRFNNPLGFDKKDLKAQLIKAIDVFCKENRSFDNHLDRNFHFSNDDEDIEILRELANYAIESNKKNEAKKGNEESEKIFIEFLSNPKVFIDKNSSTTGDYSYEPILQKFDAKKTFNSLFNANNNTLKDFNLFIKYRYKNKYDELNPEIEFLGKLKAIIEKTEFGEKLPVKKFLFNGLGNEIQDILEKYKVN